MEWVIPALVVVCLFSGVCSGLALKYAIDAKIEVRALQKSTHNIQFVPIDPNADANDKAAREAMDRHDQEAMKDLGKIHSQYSPGEI